MKKKKERMIVYFIAQLIGLCINALQTHGTRAHFVRRLTINCFFFLFFFVVVVVYFFSFDYFFVVLGGGRAFCLGKKRRRRNHFASCQLEMP